MIGLKRGTVKLYTHDPSWETEAQSTICRLREILGGAAKDIQHIGSTSIPSIMAKPIIDIAVAAEHFEDILALKSPLETAGFYDRSDSGPENQLLFACGSFYDGTGDLQTHFIHIVKTGSMEWINYINFRDYLNKTPRAAKAYEALKISLAQANPIDSGREKYLKGKHDFIRYTLRKALVDAYLGKTVTVTIDRPIGTSHPKHPEVIYPINYGYIPGVLGGDGEELDVYILGVQTPLTTFTGSVIGIVHRHNDVEDKLVAAPENMAFGASEIAAAVHFQEQFYQSHIEALEM